MRRGPNRTARIAFAPLALIVLAWASGAFAQGDKALNTLTQVEVRETEKATQIVLSGDTPPTFTVFKLSDPTRLFVDVSNADIGKVNSPIEVDNGVVSQITALQFNDDVVRVGRLIIGLEVDALYSVEARGNDLWIVVDASQRKTKRPIVINQGDAGAAEAVAAAEQRAADAEARAKAAEARAQAAQNAQAQAVAQVEAAKAQAEAARERANAAEAQANAAESQRSASAEAEARAQAAAAARDAALAEASAAEQRARDAEAAVAATRADADARVAAAEAKASAALRQAEQATAAAEAKVREAQSLAQRRADEAAAAQTQATSAAQALAQAKSATAAAEAQAQQASADANARVAAAEARLKEAQVAASAAKQSQLAAEARAREAEAAQGASQQALVAVQARAQEAQAATQAAREAQASAEARATELAASSGAARDAAAAAERRAREMAAAAEAKAQAAAAAEQQARTLAQAAEQRAAQAAQAANAQRSAAAQAEQQALAASKRANAAEERAMAAEARASKAEERASAAEERLVAIAAEKQDAEGRMRDLESAQAALAAQLDAAKAANDAARTSQLEAEERARQSELAAQQARLTQLASAQAKSESDKRIAQLENKIAQAEQAADDGKLEALQADLSTAQADAARLQQELSAKEQALASARQSAESTRAEADRLTAAAATPAPAVAKRRVTDVRFDDEATRTRIILAVQGAKPTWRVKTEGERTRVLEIDDAIIEPVLERSLDTAEFPSAVQLVSSFQAPPPGDRVRIAVTLSQAVEDTVRFEGGQLAWTFAKPTAAPAQVAAAPVPGVAPPAAPSNYAAPPPAGYTAPPAPVGFAADRAAAYVGPAQVGASNEAPTTRRRRRLKKKYSGRKINIDIKDGDIHNILRLLAKEGNVNIVTSDEVKGSVTLHLKLVPWDQALDIILRSKGLDMVREGDIIRVAPAEVIAKEQAAQLEKMKVKEQLEPLKVKLLTVNHAQAINLANRVKNLLSARGKVDFDERTNTLIVNDVADHIEAAADLVRRLDTQTSQILLQARIVEVNTNELQELGIQWGGNATAAPAFGNSTGLYFPGVIGVAGGADDQQIPSFGVPAQPNFVVNLPAAAGGGSGGALGMQFGSIDGAFNLNVRLSALENRGTVRIISEPRIATLDNVRATIKDGVRIPISQVSAAGIQTQFFDANLELQATPQVTQDGNIYLDLKVTKATPDFQNTAARGDPTILTKEAVTRLLMADNETMVIGGIYSSQAGYSYAEVPLLGRIPIIGALFRKYTEDNRRSELLIFVTPQIMNRRESSVRTAN